MTKHDEPTVRVNLTRPVEGGFGPGPADVPESVAHRLVAGGLATPIQGEESSTRETDETDDTSETAGESEAEPTHHAAKRTGRRSR